jgi:hypothetical protein
MRTAIWPVSIRPINDLFAFAKPINRSTANGGAVHMRNVRRTLGLLRKHSGVKSRRSLVATNAAFTYSVVLTRVDRNAFGANCMNHRLNRSTDAAMSAFQRCGLSALSLFGGMNAIVGTRLVGRLLGRQKLSYRELSILGRLLTVDEVIYITHVAPESPPES